MSIFDYLKNPKKLLHMLFKKISLLNSPEETPTEYLTLEVSDIQLPEDYYNPNKYIPFKRRIKLEYTSKLEQLFNTPNQLDTMDYHNIDKIIVGSILEEEHASEELMTLFNKSPSFSCSTNCSSNNFVSQLDKDFSCFIFPNSNYEKTKEGIEARKNFLKKNISISSNKNSYTIIGYYSQPDNQCMYFLKQTISIKEKGLINYSLETACMPSQSKKSSSIKHVKSLVRKNNTDMHLEEYVSDKSAPSSNYHYTISRHSDSDNVTKVSVSQGNSVINSYSVINAPNSFLSSPLGWFKNNSDVQALLKGEKSPEELPSSRDNSTDDNLDTQRV